MYLTATGMVSAVGFSAAASCAAIRAGLAGFTELPYKDIRHEPVIGAAVPMPGLETRLHPRLIRLLGFAVTEIIRSRAEVKWRTVPLLVGLAEGGPGRRPGGADDLAATVVQQLEKLLQIQFHPDMSGAFPRGHVAGFASLSHACDLAKQGRANVSLVCAVDSYINGPSLAWLESARRLKTPDNSDGVIPGEAAAAVLLERTARFPVAEVVGLGFAVEEASVLGSAPLLGIGLATAARAPLRMAGWGFHEIDFRLSDAAGESYAFREQALAHSRLMRVVRTEDHPLWTPAESIGDTGAAAGLVQLTIAAAAWRKGYAPGDRAACFTSSVSGARAVALLRRCPWPEA